MGLAIVDALQNQEGLCLASIWVREGQSIDDLADDILVSPDINHVADAADVIIDFSLPEGTVEVFAEGAMRAARWVVGQNPGRYQMRHVLFGE